MDDEKSSGRHKSGNYRKRSRSQHDNGKRKRHSSSHDNSSITIEPIDTIYRILCPIKKIGSVLGKGGDIINALRDETQAKIRVVDAIPGAEQRVIIIFSYESQKSDRLDSDEDPDDTGNESEDMKPHCPAQDALLKVHDRIAADEFLRGGMVHERTDPHDVVTTHLLVPNNQVGCLLGKGGIIIQRLRSDTGATIRLLPSENLPPCAMESDEIVQISGVPSIARKALYKISTLLHQHPRKENYPVEDLILASTRGLHRSGSSMPLQLPQGNRTWSHQLPDVHVPHTATWFGGYREEPAGYAAGNYSRNHGANVGDAAEDFVIRILCATGKIGGVIGKGGVNVRQLEQQTGARVQVEDTSSEAEERVIVLSSKEVPWDPVSPTIEALLQLQTKTSSTSENGVITTRLLVPSSKVGCILGQGGNIITEMRRRTRAEIRVFSKDDKPNYISINEEIVQVSGNQSVAKEALAEIASRLRARTLRGGNAAIDPAPPESFHGLPSSERLSNRQTSASVNLGANLAPTSHFRGFASPESFPARGLPSSSMHGMGNAVSYDYPRGVGQAHEDQGYPGPPSSMRYPNVSNSTEVKISNNTGVYPFGAGGSMISDFHQIPGSRFTQHDTLSGSSERVDFHGTSNQTKSTHSFPPVYSVYDGQSLPRMQA